LPAGYLREPLSALGRANTALLIGAREDMVKLERTRGILASRFPKLPLMILYQEPETWVNAASGEKAAKPPLDHPVLVCGIARPERFMNMVRASGIIPGEELIFSDHHDYLRNDFAKTRELYSKGIITTEKDVAKLCAAGIAAAQRVWYLSIRLCFDGTENERNFYGLIDKHLPNI
jgi:tetraacyldisaccharide 4'-kinase